MADYKIEVTTGDMENAGTTDHIYVTLFGTEGHSTQTELGNLDSDFATGTVSRTKMNDAYILSLNLFFCLCKCIR